LFSVLTIEIDGHFHGSSDVPRPWVATILGTDPKYGLRREFVRAMTDWKDAHVAWSGNVYGREARFLLRDGNLYEVSRLRGKSSKRYQAREFLAVEGRKRIKLEPEEALARVDGLGECATLRIPEDRSGESCSRMASTRSWSTAADGSFAQRSTPPHEWMSARRGHGW
jgi:hypothetical protein